MLRIIHIILLFGFTLNLQGSTDWIFSSRVATALNKVSLYPDSSYDQQAFQSLPAGVLLEVLDETVEEREDASQNQKFKWYKVRSPKGKEGWVFGDGLAVILPTKSIDPKLHSFHKQKYRFASGFGLAVLWIGGIEGHDNFYEKDYMNPVYKEHYIILTNEQGQCVFVNCSSENAQGKMYVKHLQFLDTTADEEPELLLQTVSTSVGSEYFENRNFEIYSFQSGGFGRIFEERMGLRLRNDTHSPSLFKNVEVDNGSIRIAYIDFLDCKHYKQTKDIGPYNDSAERCIEYVTYTYSWNQRTKQYQMLYEESRTGPVVTTKKDNIALLDQPSLLAKSLGSLSMSDRLELIKVHERKVIEDGVQKVSPYFFVQLKNGTTGFVKAQAIQFKDIEHATLLNKYYQKSATPNLREWKSKESFLKIMGDNRSSFTGK